MSPVPSEFRGGGGDSSGSDPLALTSPEEDRQQENSRQIPAPDACVQKAPHRGEGLLGVCPATTGRQELTVRLDMISLSSAALAVPPDKDSGTERGARSRPRGQAPPRPPCTHLLAHLALTGVRARSSARHGAHRDEQPPGPALRRLSLLHPSHSRDAPTKHQAPDPLLWGPPRTSTRGGKQATLQQKEGSESALASLKRTDCSSSVRRLLGQCHAGRGTEWDLLGGRLPELPSLKTEQCIFTLEITRESLNLKKFFEMRQNLCLNRKEKNQPTNQPTHPLPPSQTRRVPALPCRLSA